MKNSITYLPICAVLLTLLACDDPMYEFVPPTDDDSQYTVYQTSVAEPSSLCYANDGGTSLLTVSDSGGIYEIRLDGTTQRTLPFTGTNDWEAIARDAATGQVYLADEGAMTVYTLSTDETSLTQVVTIAIAGGVDNRGLEGLDYGRDTLYIANQAEPTMLIKYSLSTNEEIRIDMESVNPGHFVYLSDVYYDASDDTIWISDSKKQRVSHCNLNGRVLDWQSVGFVAKAEGLVVDRVQGVMWICCDQTAKLYRVDLKI